MSASSDHHVSQLVAALRGVLARVAEPETVLATLLQQAVSVTGARRGVFVEVSPGGELAYTVLHSHRVDHLKDSGHYSRNIFATCLATGEDILMQDARSEMPQDKRGSVVLFQMGSVLCMPVRAGGRIAGLVHLEHPRVGAFDNGHRELLRPLLELATPVLEALAAGREVLRERDTLAESERGLREEAEESRLLLAKDWSFGRFVGRSAAIRELESQVRRGAGAPYPVLLVGETGTGKNILARIVHSASPRAKKPYVTVFCPSLERSMVESELFGHRRGAFTGADSDRAGKIQKAEGGTLFLDEIGELPLEIQPKLLRLLQEKTYERLGDAEERRADVRVVAATNRDIEHEVSEGRFRRDLFERLNYVPIRVPPLRERRQDIAAILRHCLDQTDAGRWAEVSDEGLRWLEKLDFSWPGNVRHLEQLAARITVERPRGPVGVDDLQRLLGALEPRPVVVPARLPEVPGGLPVDAPDAPADDLDDGLPRHRADAERRRIEEALRRHPHETRAELAERLKISESTLYKKLRDYGLGG
jgi:transcriptional regulator with GAF, ATPase, and Fis domain